MRQSTYALRPRLLSGLALLGLLFGGCTIHLEPDQDGDGYPARRDCDDRDANVHPSAEEACDGRDNDCDGLTDDADRDTQPLGAQTWFADEDGDTFGDGSAPLKACLVPAGHVVNEADCNDQDAAIRPGALEACDGQDNDCDGLVDDADTDGIPEGVQLWYADEDLDGYGDGASIQLACTRPTGFVPLGNGLLDCNDADEAIHPGAIEACDGVDNDCDGEIDDDTAQVIPWYPDLDLDGHGDVAQVVLSCPGPAGWVSIGDDCDDHNPAVYWDALEVCDGLDNDCDELVDEGLLQPYYPDADGDGYGTMAGSVVACAPPPGYSTESGDCDDTSATTWPGAPSLCDGRDDDCDGQIDAAATLYYRDQDGDGFGDVASTACTLEAGYVAAKGDCDDLDPAVHAGADDPADDGVDQDCGGTEGPEPHVGLSTGSLSSIQAALDAAAPGSVVWVGPGHYLELDVSFRGRALKLATTHGPQQTILDVNHASKHSGLVFTSGEEADTIVEGLGITGANGGYGASGVYIVASSPTLIGCRIFNNYVVGSGNGGGIYMKWSYARIRGCTFENNNVDYCGGAVYMESSSPVIEQSTFSRNNATWGGALYSFYSKPVIRGSTFESNEGWSLGGGLYLYKSTASMSGLTLSGNGGCGIYAASDSSTLVQSRLVGNALCGLYGSDSSSTSLENVALVDNSGPGLLLSSGSYRVSNSIITGNHSSTDGAGVYVGSAQVALVNTLIVRNEAARDGGGLYVSQGSATLEHVIVAGNRAASGNGGVRAGSSGSTSLTLRESILAYNDGYELAVGTSTSFSTLYSVFYSPEDSSMTGLSAPLDASNLELEPGFLEFDGAGVPVDFHLAPDSALIDRGDASRTDSDGSVSDPGIYGGSAGARWDQDGDGYPGYFWPGQFRQAPAGIDPATFDCDDSDASLPTGGGACP